jgi:hypothetical protein
MSIIGSHEMEIVTKDAEQSRVLARGRTPGSDRVWRGGRSRSEGRGRLAFGSFAI